MGKLDSIPIFICEFSHGKSLKAYDLDWISFQFLALRDDQYVSNKHAVDVGQFALKHHFGVEGVLDVVEEVGGAVGEAPDVDMEAGVVAFEEFGVAADPL